MEIRYQVYPTLLNQFHKYLLVKMQEVENEVVARKELLDRINRVPITDEELLKKFKRGNNFEKAVIEFADHDFDENLVESVRKLLPRRAFKQKLITFEYENIKFYGYADIVGENRIVDIKTTSEYSENTHAFNFQTLYLFGLKEQGFQTMEYIITDLKEIFVEKYSLDDFDFKPMLSEMRLFTEFLEQNRAEITDSKIFVE